MTTLSTTTTNTFGYTGQIETVTIGVAGYYEIMAEGAEGGSGDATAAGLGAMASGEVYLQAGAVLEVIVGGEGGSSASSAGGGGGGSFVIETQVGAGAPATTIDLVVAGGGGGGGYLGSSGGGGRTKGSGGNGGVSGGAGGLNGAAGSGGGSKGGGGGGLTGGSGGTSPGSALATTFSGGAGTNGGGGGGFGGGGGGGSYGGGGGGGYGGGGGGGVDVDVEGGAGGGGGSYVAATSDGVTTLSEVVTGGTHAGNGLVTIALETVIIRGTTPASQTTTSEAPIRPFAGTTITDINAGAPLDTATITTSGGGGTLSDANLSSGSGLAAGTYSATAGSFTFTDTAANFTADLQALTFTAANTPGFASTTNISLSIASSSDPGVSATAATSVTDTDPLTLSSTSANTFVETGRIEMVTVGATGYYDISADGAEGGSGDSTSDGLGAMASGEVYLQAGAVLEIVVGGQGGSSGESGGGGGGGSFVIETKAGPGAPTTPIDLVIAGGGGGGGYLGSSGGGGRTKGSGGKGGGISGGAGGLNGAAGSGGGGVRGGGGGGFTGGNAGHNSGSTLGTTFSGGAGTNGGGGGGFGGGGGAGSYGGGGAGGFGGGGGGGGFGGGDGGTSGAGGGGGGSYVTAASDGVATLSEALTGGTHSGNGLIAITAALVAPVFSGVKSTAQFTTSEAAIDPFSTVALTDANLGSPTETLTITLSGPDLGALALTQTGTGATLTGSGASYSLTGTASAVTAALQVLAYRPVDGVANTSVTTSFTLSDQSSVYPLAVTATASVTDIDPAVATVVSGAIAGQVFGVSSPDAPFSTMVVTDANAGTTDTVLIGFTAGGALSGAGLSELAPGLYELSATSAAQATSELDALLYTPVVTGAVQSVSFEVNDVTSASTATYGPQTTITIDPGPKAGGGALTVNQGASVNETAYLLSLVTPGLAGDTETITAVSGANVKLAGGVVTYTAPATASDSFTYTVQDQFGDSATGTVKVTVNPTTLSISGAIASQPTTNGKAVTPFAAVTVADPSPGATETLKITLNGGGTLADGSGYSGLTTSGAGVYVLKGTAAAVTKELDALVFTPPSAAPNTVETTGFTLQDTSSAGGSATNSTASVVNTDPAVAPVVSGAISGQVFGVSSPDAPFSKMIVTDANANTTDTVLIGFTGGGALSGAGLSQLAAGLYELAATSAANATSELQALLYTPVSTGSSQSVSFAVNDVTSASTVDYGPQTTITIDPGPRTGLVSATVPYGDGVNLTSAVLAAATPGLRGDTLTIVADNAAATLGNAALVGGQLIYAASSAAVSHIPANGSLADTLGYTISDEYGDTATGVVKITVTNPADTINGSTLGHATIQGTAGADVINAYGLLNTIYDNGGNDLVNAGSGYDTVYNGAGDVVTDLQGLFDTVVGGNGNDTVSGSTGNATITLGNGNDKVTAGGNGNTISLGSGTDSVTLTGSGNGVTLNGSTATLTNAAGLDSISVNGGKDTLDLYGASDTATIGGVATMTIADLGTSLRINVTSATQTDVITGFGSSDAKGVFDFKNGVGGFTSTSAILSALSSDGHGGALLSLGSSGSIDFSGVAPTLLHASNFAIG